MAKITDDTTLAQLGVEKSLLGIETITVMTDFKGRVATVIHPTFGARLGQGVTEADAIEAAFQRIRKALEDSFKAA